ncbi:MAG TPA: aldehyde dehydrogenase family protein [Desulfobacterales bacterium]|nr:aldehyde dehydrogenase family protein [Desulfobacterales bacterium]
MQDYRGIVGQAAAAFSVWRTVPAPKRGEVVRQIAEVLRRQK